MDSDWSTCSFLSLDPIKYSYELGTMQYMSKQDRLKLHKLAANPYITDF